MSVTNGGQRRAMRGAALPTELNVMHPDSAHQLVEVSMGMKDFSAEWMHCDRISSYVARLVSQNQSDSLLYANLFSSALNELLETAFAHHGAGGDFTCRVSRTDVADRIDLILPCDEPTLRFYTDAVALLGRSDLQDLYHAALFAADQPDPRLGIFEVAVDYNAKISVSTDDGRLTLSAEMALGGAC
jgi:hypothetical protein